MAGDKLERRIRREMAVAQIVRKGKGILGVEKQNKNKKMLWVMVI